MENVYAVVCHLTLLLSQSFQFLRFTPTGQSWWLPSQLVSLWLCKVLWDAFEWDLALYEIKVDERKYFLVNFQCEVYSDWSPRQEMIYSLYCSQDAQFDLRCALPALCVDDLVSLQSTAPLCSSTCWPVSLISAQTHHTASTSACPSCGSSSSPQWPSSAGTGLSTRPSGTTAWWWTLYSGVWIFNASGSKSSLKEYLMYF